MLPLLSVFVLLAISQLSHQEKYLCNLNASCGCSTSSEIRTKIVGGKDAKVRAWGWVVSIRKDGKHWCGGSILSSTWVLTAAHCVFGIEISELTVFAGSIHVHRGRQKRKVALVISHPNYDVDSLLNDIALVQISSPFNMINRDLAKICLPIFTTNEHPPVGSKVVAIGWGKLAENDASPSDFLQQVTLKTIPYNSNACKSSRSWSSDVSIQFCAGADDGSNKDTCGGDSGGPVMMFTASKQWVIVGLTSYGKGCGRAQYSGVYLRVVSYLDWINSAMDTTGDSSPPEYETIEDDNGKLISNICSRHYSLSLFCIATWTVLSLRFV